METMMSTELYLLSISENLARTVFGVGCLWFVLTGVYVIFSMFYWAALEKCPPKTIVISALGFLFAGVLFTLSSAAIPTPRKIAEAHLLIEARQLVTAEGAKDAANEILPRVDRIIELLSEPEVPVK